MLTIACAAAAATSALATWLLVGVLRRWSVLDVPIGRSTHSEATPRGGGLALALGTLVAVAILHGRMDEFSLAALLVAGIGAGALGLADDVTGGVPVPIRLAGQAGIAVASVALALHGWHAAAAWYLLAAFVGVVWTIGFTNAFNFMDGINGIAGAQAIVAGVALGLVGRRDHAATLEAASFALAAGALGFLPFNFPRARVFLGDVGSYFAGAWQAVLVIIAVVAQVPPEAAIAPMALFATDAGVTLVRRVASGQPWQTAHRDHVYQRLFDLGWSQVAITSMVGGAVAACAALGAVSLGGAPVARALADVAIVAILLGYLSIPRLVSRGRPRAPGSTTGAIGKGRGA
jgi:UDP-GlcNAc:undecaprenyl-phosphate/decaprenyl-phosphate GlcNAc-1-phosphate transferase